MRENGVIASRDARTSAVRYDYGVVRLYCRCGWRTLLYHDHARLPYVQSSYARLYHFHEHGPHEAPVFVKSPGQ